MEKQIILEKSTNTHVTKSNGVNVVKELPEMTTVVLEVNDDSVVVEHGHHATVATEKETIQAIKITQQEQNPVTKKYMNAAD